MATIQIRDIPEEDYESLRRDARAHGQSLQSYMRDVAISRAAFVAKPEIMAAMREVARSNTGTGVTIENILAAKDEGVRD